MSPLDEIMEEQHRYIVKLLTPRIERAPSSPKVVRPSRRAAVRALRLHGVHLAYFATPRTWDEILATGWYDEPQWRWLVIRGEDEKVLVWLPAPRKAWIMTDSYKRTITDKVPIADIRAALAKHEPMVTCPLGDDPDCPLCGGVGTVPVHVLSLPETA